MKKQIAFAIFMLLISPSFAEANAGVPMLAILWPAMFVGLIPIIVIESLIISRDLAIPWKTSCKIMSYANIESTIIGIPLTWVVLVLVEMIFGYSFFLFGINKLPEHIQSIIDIVFQLSLGAAWLGPSEENLHWLIPSAATILLVPFFFVTCWYEFTRVKKHLTNYDLTRVKEVVIKANVITYGLLATLSVTWLIISIIKGII